MAIDPVCGMTVDEKTAAGSSTREGTIDYFCCNALRLRRVRL